MFLDILFLILLIYTTIKGYKKGAIFNLVSILSYFIAIVAALAFSSTVAKLLLQYVRPDNVLLMQVLPLLSYCLVFFIAIYAIRFLAAFVKRLVRTVGVGFLDKILGALINILKVCVGISVLYWYSQKLNLLNPGVTENSISYNILKNWAPVIIDSIQVLLPFLKSMFADLKAYFESLNNQLSSHVGAY